MGLSDYYEDREYVFEKQIADLETQLAEARAEIEQYKMGKISPADYYSMAEAETGLCNEIAALRAEIAADEARLVAYVARVSGEIERKDKLIEQMREAVKFSLIADEVRQTRNVCASDINDACETSRIKRMAALSAAAERGGG